jgi:hypothetical protein
MRLSNELDERIDAIASTLPQNVVERKVSIMFSAGFTEPSKFEFRSENDVTSFASACRIIVLRDRDRQVPHFDRIKEQLLRDYRTAKKAQIDDVLEAAGVTALEREREALEGSGQ